MATMRAAVIREAGGPDVLTVESWPKPVPTEQQALIRVRAFGLNRSELFTRRGLSPGVRFPRVLGIEAVGEIVSSPGGQFEVGRKVATAMGGMGRDFDGGYAEYVCVPVSQVQSTARILAAAERDRREVSER
jgi:NADPH:quinone reductase-like Zn-dependent oxidoreductase